MSKPVNIGIIGLGYWGPNWLRNFASLSRCTVKYGCDLSKERCQKFSALYPSITFTQSVDDLLSDTTLDAVIIATPTSTHFALAKAALESGKHVLVEKPMTSSSAEAKQLVALATKKKKLLLVDHTFAYTEAVQKIQSLISDKKLGSLLYFDSTRINLGLIQKDTSVFHDLAVHDLTILNAIMPLSQASTIFATGNSYYGKTIEVGHLHIGYPSGFNAHIHVSWLSPVKIRSTLIGGKKAMIVYNDIEPSEKIRLYDKGIDHDETKADPFFPKYRSGDILIPALSSAETLETEAQHFLDCIDGKTKPLVSGRDGEAMIKVLSKAMESIERQKTLPLV